ncbi:hypothetical protein QJS10_CPB21g00462 [Acorus calamus]|uniref:Uncharacterized protein n=1 Tax=Acorus calamus TaxID=4465 RepID=A0AAV9C6D6_ACOCL|nr:hypothetical protein QJS10_CPB21g00462 [Acorus calamus]
MGRNYLLGFDGETTEIILSGSPHPSRKSMPCRTVGVNDNMELKRGSVYQTSKEVREMKKLREARRKIKLAHCNEALLSSSSNNSLSLAQQKRSRDQIPKTVAHSHMDSVTPDFLDLSFRHLSEAPPRTHHLTPDFVIDDEIPTDGFLEICLHPGESEHCCPKVVSEHVEGRPEAEPSIKSKKELAHTKDSNSLIDRDAVLTLPKSFSAKVGVLDLPFRSGSDQCKSSPNARFRPFKKMFDPIMKSKSQRNPSLSVTEVNSPANVDLANTNRSRMSHKALLDGFSKITEIPVHNDQTVEKDQSSSPSPVHLHGILKLEFKHDVPYFQFSVNNLEDDLVARTWGMQNGDNLIYTFHSVDNNKKSSSKVWGMKDRHKHAPMVGQMQVSCYLCSEVSTHGFLVNSTVTEFILYDVGKARKRKSFVVEESPPCSVNSSIPPKVSDGEVLIMGTPSKAIGSLEPETDSVPSRNGLDCCDSIASTSQPWDPSYLHPHLETAAIVIQVPFWKDEVKGKSGDKFECEKNIDCESLSANEGRNGINRSSLGPANVKAVTASGTHGLPITDEAGGPSPLLDRWRSGGGCDCGGWDMACPIVVLDNLKITNVADHSFIENQQPFELFVQGSKERTPALIIKTIDDGRYGVDFHAQLTTLQAFSICVAILHRATASAAVGRDRDAQRLHSNSLKLLLEEEVRHWIEAVAAEEKRKAKTGTGEVPPSLVLDPPFSPIGRV